MACELVKFGDSGLDIRLLSGHHSWGARFAWGIRRWGIWSARCRRRTRAGEQPELMTGREKSPGANDYLGRHSQECMLERRRPCLAIRSRHQAYPPPIFGGRESRGCEASPSCYFRHSSLSLTSVVERLLQRNDKELPSLVEMPRRAESAYPGDKRVHHQDHQCAGKPRAPTGPAN